MVNVLNESRVITQRSWLKHICSHACTDFNAYEPSTKFCKLCKKFEAFVPGTSHFYLSSDLDCY